MGAIDWGKLIQTVLEAVLAMVLPVAVAYAAQWLRAMRSQLLSQLDEKAQAMVRQAVAIAVRAAEQSGLAEHIEDSGRAKKEFALDWAEKYLASWGVELDLDVLSGMIEAEVRRQFGEREYHILPNNEFSVSLRDFMELGL